MTVSAGTHVDASGSGTGTGTGSGGGGLSLFDAGLSFSPTQHALHGVTLQVPAGAQVAVIGPSGAGKSSLLRLLSASLQPSQGRLSVLGRNPWQLSPSALRRLRTRIGVLHQAAPIPPRLRVVTAVLAGRLGQWGAWRSLGSLLMPTDLAGARQALARVDLADRLFDRRDQLSGGQLQRVGIARVLYQRPDLLLADEPVSALDPALSDAVIEQLMAQSRDTGATLVASLHAVDLALKWFPRVIGLRGGEVLFDRPAAEVTADMLRTLYAGEIGLVSLALTPSAAQASPPPVPAAARVLPGPGCR